MEVQYLSRPRISEPSMVAAWPGMGYLAKISADYLRKRLKAVLFAEITYYQNSIVYRDGLAELPQISHRLYAAPDKGLIICIGEAQPSVPEEAYRLARCIIGIAKRFEVSRVYTMAAYPSENIGTPRVYGVCTNEELKEVLINHDVSVLDGEGMVTGLNGVFIGVAKNSGIEGVCLLGEIRYANVPQNLSAKSVLDRLTSILGICIDTSLLEKRARRVDDSLRRKLDRFQVSEKGPRKTERDFRYIS